MVWDSIWDNFKNGILVVSISLQTCLGDNLDVTESCRNSMYWVRLQRSYGAAKGERSFPIEFTNDRYSDIESLIGNGTLMAQIPGFLPYLHLFKTSSDSFWSSWCQKKCCEALLFEVDAWSQGYVIFSIIPTGPVSAFPCMEVEDVLRKEGMFQVRASSFRGRVLGQFFGNPQKDLSKEAP